ncbi:hypothetical protein DNTS_007941 [Danionella cerebrum]|uniref:Uncharacterized protein n=1 Tax=Danionella cerebrum TaxID=2873325 RepID=A0A553MVV3_9TELE|nr:hypothetical protein DNTS_007941 [Danionella translucida]
MCGCTCPWAFSMASPHPGLKRVCRNTRSRPRSFRCGVHWPFSWALLESSADDLDLLFSYPNHFPPRTLHSIFAFSHRLLKSSGLACDFVHRVAHFPRGGRCRWDTCNTVLQELGPGSGGILACTLEGGEPREIVVSLLPWCKTGEAISYVHVSGPAPSKGLQRVQNRLLL